MTSSLPLEGIRVIEVASTVAGAYAGQLLQAMGAEVIMVESPEGSPLRQIPPFLGETGLSALFASLTAGKKSVILDLRKPQGREDLDQLLASSALLLTDMALADRGHQGLDPRKIALAHSALTYVSVLPFGGAGPKAGWKGAEITLFHAGGEGYLMPNGLTADLFPERAPLKIHGYFAERQGGTAAALAALAALWRGIGEYVDISVQDANLAVGAFAIQRLGDGSVEHRSTRSFRYGGVIECADGYVELLTLEERQWQGLIELLGRPDWIMDPKLADPVARSAEGPELNRRIRAWAKDLPVETLVSRAQALGVPMARYNRPEDVVAGAHETARGVFQPLGVEGLGDLPLQTAPFRFGKAPLPLSGPPPEAGEHQWLIAPQALRAREGSLA